MRKYKTSDYGIGNGHAKERQLCLQCQKNQMPRATVNVHKTDRGISGVRVSARFWKNSLPRFFLMQFGLCRATPFLSSPIHLFETILSLHFFCYCGQTRLSLNQLCFHAIDKILINIDNRSDKADCCCFGLAFVLKTAYRYQYSLWLDAAT